MRVWFPLLVLLLVPSLALADASVIQGPCEEVPGADLLEVNFQVVNFSLPAPICDLHLTPEPFPSNWWCQPQNCSSPSGWSCFLGPGGMIDWFANTPADCIDPGEIKGFFDFVRPRAGGFCCFIVQFTDPTGAVILEQEECFDCTGIANAATSWSAIKALFD